MRLDSARVELVALPARRLCRRGLVALFHVHVPDAQNDPAVRRKRQCLAQPDNAHGRRRNERRRILLWVRTFQLPAQGLGGKRLPVVKPRRRAEADERQTNVVRRGQRKPPFVCCLFFAGKRERHIVLPVALRTFHIADLPPAGSGLHLERDMQIRVVAPRADHLARRRQFKGADGDRRRKAEKTRVCVCLNLARLEQSSIPRIAKRRRECQNADIVPIAVCVAILVRNGDFARDATGDISPCIHHLPHCVRRRNPRPAAHRPSGAVLHLERQPQPRAFVGGVCDEAVPFLAQARYLLPDPVPRPRLPVLPVEERDAAEARRLYRFKVGGQPRLGRIATDDVEPRLWAAIFDIYGKRRTADRQNEHDNDAENTHHAIVISCPWKRKLPPTTYSLSPMRTACTAAEIAAGLEP